MTSRSLQVLNAVQAYIIKFANENGIVLADEFESVDHFKKFVISLTIRTAMEIGLSLQEAYDLVIGDGEYQKLADAIWEANQ